MAEKAQETLKIDGEKLATVERGGDIQTSDDVSIYTSIVADIIARKQNEAKTGRV